MTSPHFAHWPPGLPRHLTLPETSLWFNAEVSAQRYPNKPYIVYYDTPLSFSQFRDQAERFGAHLLARFHRHQVLAAGFGHQPTGGLERQRPHV